MSGRNKLRSKRGQGISEAVSVAVALTILFTLLVAFAADIYMYCTYSAKLQTVANEAAKVFRDNDFWMGAQRPSFQRNDAEQQAQKEGMGNACANAVARDLGITNSLNNKVYLSHIEHVVVEHGAGRFSEFTKCTFTLPYFNLPYQFAGLFSNVLSLKATGIASQSTEEPPAFIRLGYNLTTDDTITPANSTDVTQVCILPSYGFLTDPPEPGSIAANLGLNRANADVAANHPDDRYCGWNGLNVSMKPTATDPVPRLLGNAPRQKNAEGGYTPYFGGPLNE